MAFTDTDRVDWPRLRTALLLVGLFVVLWVMISVVISATLVRPFVVSGDSMSPTLQHGERLAVLLPGAPDRRDMVILDAPPQARAPRGATFIKRVVAIPGDSVSCCSDGHLVVNGQVVSEPYAARSQPKIARVRVPEGDVFVLGDNRLDSEDSRSWGPIPANLVIGSIVAQGSTAVALSPLVLGCVVALALTFAFWIFWVRRKTRPGLESSSPQETDDRPGSTNHLPVS